MLAAADDPRVGRTAGGVGSGDRGRGGDENALGAGRRHVVVERDGDLVAPRLSPGWR